MEQEQVVTAPVFKVVIIDCEKAGMIGGPFQVIVTKDGKYIAGHSGIRGMTGAEGVARNFRHTYGVAA